MARSFHLPHLPAAAPALCTCPGPLFKCYLTLAQKCHDCLPLLRMCVCSCVYVCVWVWQTHKMPHSCCKICGHSSLQKPNHPPHPIPLSTGPRLKWITNPQKKNVRNFTLIWLNGFIGFDICSFVDSFRSLNFVLILLLLLPLF